MNFTSFLFLTCFLLPAFTLHSLLRSKTAANAVLLICSILFYGCYDWKYLLFLGACVAVTYLGGALGHRFRQQGKQALGRGILFGALTANILMLLVCKYTGFALQNINVLLAPANVRIELPGILLPVGLSFYVFQSSSYLLDIHFGKLEPERNLLSYALFVSFFPTITSGPIQRATDLLPQINSRRSLSWDGFRHAVLLFLWGAFLKMVIADKLAVFTSAVFDAYHQCGFFQLFPAMCAYSVQIYGDFAGYSYMAAAIAMLFGFRLKPNFLRPYAARSIGEFWRRWHISLSSWFRDYIYIPLGGNRRGELRKYLNLTVVFLVSGLWHGASWSFILWGGIHAFYQVFGALTQKYRRAAVKALGIRTDCFSYRLFQRIIVFLLVSVAWVFFRAGNAGEALACLRQMVFQLGFNKLIEGAVWTLGLDGVTVAAVGLLVLVSTLQEKGMDIRFFLEQNLLLRWLVYTALIIVLILFGAYGPTFNASDFIYAAF